MYIDNIVRKLDLVTLIIFKTICEEKSLSKAAQKNMIALSAASKRLTDLEQSIGTKLFIRDNKGMQITPAGESLLYHCRSILDSVYQASIELDEFKHGVKGFIRLQANLSTIIQFLPEDLSSFIKNNPQIKIELEERPSLEILEHVQNKTADLGICVVENKTVDLIYEKYRNDRLVVVAQNESYLQEKQIISFEDALDHDFIGLHAQSAINRILKAKADDLGKQLKLRILVTSFDAVCRMIQAGMGIGILPEKVYEILGKPLGLSAISLSESWAYRELYVVSKADEFLNPVTLLLKQHLLNCHL
ncbi:LysR family transcriptional regulator [Acinetobacter populi]|jgi:DNA-binding transcriptional LysR family regulator|uniref:LysR family transcriptional regulator n=1 Tax=Acinetobacter populi TaxID=1582270 RepID=A0A1Z9Z2A8_9GAMM|nr:LysR family transcriptional regulator [Acinetobacter populi]MCH4246943.1 LysR family transcriptional regulator [Acinetobacter populi]OUY08600.1 LysR family transcriptional regulator [Acinetobacter populi]